jgi:hypothetical protein
VCLLILLSELDQQNYVCILLLRLGISGASPYLLLNQSFSFDTNISMLRVQACILARMGVPKMVKNGLNSSFVIWGQF